MKRISIVGLCLVAAFAVSAVVTSVAAAAFPPEYGQCVAQKKGKYSDAGCLKAVTKKGTHEWIPSDKCYAKKKGKYLDSKCTKKVTKKGKFELSPSPKYTDTTGKAVLNTPEHGSIECESSISEGVITGPKTDKDEVIFFKCTTLGHTCFNAVVGGEKVIETFPLETNVVEVGGKVEIEFVNAKEFGAPFSSEFECEEVTAIRTKGFTDGIPSPLNKMSTTSSTNFAGNTTLKTEFVLGLNGKGEPEWSGGTGGGPNEFGPFGEFGSEEVTTGGSVFATAIELRE